MNLGLGYLGFRVYPNVLVFLRCLCRLSERHIKVLFHRRASDVSAAMSARSTMIAYLAGLQICDKVQPLQVSEPLQLSTTSL